MAKTFRKALRDLYSGVKKKNLENLYYEKYENKNSAMYKKVQDEFDYLVDDFLKVAIRNFINEFDENEKTFKLTDEWLVKLAQKTYESWIPSKVTRNWVQKKIVEFIKEGAQNDEE